MRASEQQIVQPDLDAIIERTQLLPAEEIFDMVKSPGERVAMEAFLELTDQTRFNLSRAKEIFAVPCIKSEDFSRRLELFQTAEQVLVHECVLVDEQLSDARYSEGKLDCRLMNAIDSLQCNGSMQKLAAVLLSQRHREERFRAAAVASRQQLTKRVRIEAEADALDDALAQVRAEIAYLEGRLKNCRSLLARFASASGVQTRPPFVKTVTFDELLPDLLDIRPNDPAPRVLKTLGAAVRCVTTAGLGKILGSDSDRLEDLVGLLARGEPAEHVEDHVEVEVGPLGRSAELGDIP